MDERPRDRSEHEVKRNTGRKTGGKKQGGSKKSKNDGQSTTAGPENAKAKKRQKKTKGQNVRLTAQHKLVVRLLPPNLTEKQFFEVVFKALGSASGKSSDAGFFSQDVESHYYVPGHYSRKPFKQPTYSRAYLTFYEPAKVQDFVRTIGNLKFTDDTNNSMMPTMSASPYVKKLRTEDSKGVKGIKSRLEGSIEKDKIFQTFLKSLALLEEERDLYGYAELSVIQPLQKGLDRKREEEARIRHQGERAIIALAGEVTKEKSKRKKKSKTKKKVSDAGEPKKKTKKPTSKGSSEDKQNMVIIEAAGRRELQRRERIKKMVEREANIGSVATANPAENKSQPSNKSGKKAKGKKRPSSKAKKKDGAGGQGPKKPDA
ncbi:LADA_0B07668g1_1 [Lachancea dasiensis]|uniref:LADA_0B07668g1_1 n=1 Tax=Lachancea dasiensis TaxID=1072105 RepID=A0A1G4IU00_9SACH|nr:LADA_0B07668g1_1 [Lachancea dasiensis]